MKVLVPVDGSPNINACLKRLGRRHWATHDSVHLIAVVDFLRLTEQQANSVIEDALSSFKDTNVTVYTSISHGKAAFEILTLAHSEDVDLICMGAHGKHGWRDAFIGSVAHNVAEHAKCTVSLHKWNGDRPDDPLKKLLVCVDNDDNMTSLLMNAVERSVSNRQLEVMVLHVVDLIDLKQPASSENPHVDALLYKQSIENSRTAMEFAFTKAHESFTEKCPNSIISFRIVEDTEVVGTILDVARTWSAEVIVVGTHGRTGIDKFWLGSVSEGVFKNAPCSIQIVRNAAAELH